MSADMFADVRRTVTALVRTPTGERDDYGNTRWGDAEVDVADCLIAPGESGDDQSDADRTTTTATIYDLANRWPGGTVNRVRFDDATWEVAGDPERWPGPIGGTVIHVRKVAG